MEAKKKPDMSGEPSPKIESAVVFRAQRDFKAWIRHSLVEFKKHDIIPEYLVKDLKLHKCPIIEDRIVTV